MRNAPQVSAPHARRRRTHGRRRRSAHARSYCWLFDIRTSISAKSPPSSSFSNLRTTPLPGAFIGVGVQSPPQIDSNTPLLSLPSWSLLRQVVSSNMTACELGAPCSGALLMCAGAPFALGRCDHRCAPTVDLDYEDFTIVVGRRGLFEKRF